MIQVEFLLWGCLLLHKTISSLLLCHSRASEVALRSTTRNDQTIYLYSQTIAIVFPVACLPKGESFWFLPPANEVWSKVMFSQASLCWRVCGRAPQATHRADTPPGKHPPPSGQIPSQADIPPKTRPLKQAVRILLECILLYFKTLISVW